MMKMQRKPTFAGKVSEKDAQDIMFWAIQKSPVERLEESWRLHCANHGVDINIRLNREVSKARKRDNQEKLKKIRKQKKINRL